MTNIKGSLSFAAVVALASVSMRGGHGGRGLHGFPKKRCVCTSNKDCVCPYVLIPVLSGRGRGKGCISMCACDSWGNQNDLEVTKG